MHFKTRRIIASVAVIGAVAAGGAAYTAGSGFGSQPMASYAGTVIQGAQALDLQFQYSNDGSTITQADLVLVGDYDKSTASNESKPYTIKAGFGADADSPGGNTLDPSLLTSTCTATESVTGSLITVGTITVPNDDTAVTCPFTQAVSDSLDGSSPTDIADHFNLLVTSTNPTS